VKIALIRREQLLKVGQFLVDELDSLVARIRASWNVEHTADGGHSNITAETISTGRITYGDIAEVDVVEEQVNNFDPAGLSTAGLLRLNTELGEVSITGLRVPQGSDGAVLDGRVLVIENTTADSTFILEAENTSSSPRNRFTTPYGPPQDENSPLRLYLRPSSLTTLIYNATKARWIVQSQANDNSVKYNLFAGSTTYDDRATGAIKRVRYYRVEFDGTGGAFSGFDSTDIPVTTRITFTNVGLYQFAFLHQNTGSSSANRIQCPGGVRYMLRPRESVDLYRTDSGWRIIEKADQWIDVAHSAGNFTASGGVSPTWVVDSADQQEFQYCIDGNLMIVNFRLGSTTITGNPTELRITIPNGRVAARNMFNSIAQAINNGATVLSSAFIRAESGQTYLRLFSDALGTAFANGANNNTFNGQIAFMVRDDCASISEDHTDVAHGDTAHSDADHSDVTHVDVAHTDAHSDTAHSDGFHGDVAHSDTAHADVAHVDTAHVDNHSDTAHADTPHDDTAHTDVAHVDQEQHGDVPHADVPADPPIEHEDVLHDDSTFGHEDVAHEDVAHADTAHSDTAHSDTHDDTAHSDTAHSDTVHVDVAHEDSSHSDTAHADGHSDSPHSDTAHTDIAHGDTAHADVTHEDVGYHCDTAHSDI
jgi:hypothetical protein